MRKFIPFFLAISSTLFADGNRSKVCLNMIVKDESPVIQRCLESTKPWIDYWVIIDTGSTDGTQKIIREVLKDIPGELHERPWKNFEHNRNEALNLARKKGDYLLFIDADEELKYPKNGKLPDLNIDCYLTTIKTKTVESSRIFLAKTALPWKWKGVLHEELYCESMKPTASYLGGIAIFADTEDGHRSQDPEKHLKDAAILQAALQTDPNNVRYTMFLAESYWTAGRYESALKAYEKRASLGEWDQEVYYSLYRAACCKQLLNMDAQAVIEGYTKAFQYRPTRGEPLFRLANYYLQLKNYALAYKTAKQLLSLKIPVNDLQIESAIYDYLSLALFVECAANLKKYDEAKSSAQAILLRKDIPTDIIEKVKHFIQTHPGEKTSP